MPNQSEDNRVVVLNPHTCGIYKDGRTRYKVNPTTGARTADLDDELNHQVDLYLAGSTVPGRVEVPLREIFQKKVLVPRYHDNRWEDDLLIMLAQQGLASITIGELEQAGIIRIRGGHGSPSSDARVGHVPYVKVSDIRSLRVNVNPTNLVPDAIAERLWRGIDSGLRAWDLITPNRASANIGEFAILLPGEEQVVITKEVFILRVLDSQNDLYDAFYLLWAFSLKAVRKQWQRVTLMQTNREDVGKRYKEIKIPLPPSANWAQEKSQAFRTYFTAIAEARSAFVRGTTASTFNYIASVRAVGNPALAAVDDDALEVETGTE